jgi:hypothetical protein
MYSMTPEILNRYNSKWLEVKIFFILDVLELYIVKCFNIKKCCFRQGRLSLGVPPASYWSPGSHI